MRKWVLETKLTTRIEDEAHLRSLVQPRIVRAAGAVRAAGGAAYPTNGDSNQPVGYDPTNGSLQLMIDNKGIME